MYPQHADIVNCPAPRPAIPQIGMEVLKGSEFAVGLEVEQVRSGLFSLREAGSLYDRR